MAKTPKVAEASPDGRMVYISQSGPYAGQKMALKTAHADAGVADGWAVELSDALAPNDTPATPDGDDPQSYLDWLTDIATPDEPIPPPDPPPAPTITSLNPNTAETGSADITMSVIGTGFTATSVIVFNGYDEPTTLVSATEVTTGVKPSLFTEAIPLPVEVRDVGGTSNSVDFTFTAPVEVQTAEK